MKQRVNLLSMAIGLLCLAYGALNLFNGRFTLYDLQVYYDAAGRLIDGASPYHTAFGLSSGFYKYSPSAAIFFIPLHVLGWMGARVVFFILIAGTLAAFFPRMVVCINRATGLTNNSIMLQTTLVALMLGGHLSRELLLGNVNWLLMLVLLFAFFTLEKRAGLSGVLLGFALAFKPHFAVLLPWYIVRKRYVELATAMLTLFVLFFLPAAGWGWAGNLDLLIEWFETMRMHNTGLAGSPNTLYGVPARLFGWEGQWPVVLTLALVAVMILAYVLRNFWLEATQSRLPASNMLMEFALIMALIPNLVHTDTEHFMWTFPLLVVVFGRLLDSSLAAPVRAALALVCILCALPYTLASPDLWGATRSQWLEQSGVLGWSNVVLVVMAIVLYRAPQATA